MTINKSITDRLLNAAGEIALIVIGILLALYIDNWNADQQNKKLIDSNFQRVYHELEGNIADSKDDIKGLYKKDSLIYLVLNNAVKPEDYFSGIDLAYLIINYYNLNLDDKAYRNLIQLDISDDSHKEQLLFRLKDLNDLNEIIVNNNSRMTAFVYEEALPLLARNTKTFADLTYKGKVNKDVVNYLMTSPEYKSYVSQYAIIALKNQLRYYQIYLKRASKIYRDIGKIYNFKVNKKDQYNRFSSKIKGTYYNEQYHDTMRVNYVKDSLFITRRDKRRVNLIPFAENHFITDDEEGGFFISFENSKKSKSDYRITVNLMDRQINYLKRK